MAQDYPTAYKEIERFAKEGKYRSALEQATQLYRAAERDGDQDDMLKALAYRAAYTLELEEDGTQEALKVLEAELRDNKGRPVVSPVLHYLIGKGYFSYARQNAYRLSEVTAVDDGAAVNLATPLEDWSLQQLVDAADRYLLAALEEAVQQRVELTSLPAIVKHADSPSRGLTLYDLLSEEVGGILNDPLLGVDNTAPASAPDYLAPAPEFIVMNLAGLAENSGPARRLRVFQQQLAYHLGTDNEGLMRGGPGTCQIRAWPSDTR